MNKAKKKQRKYENRLRLAKRKVRLIIHETDEHESFIRKMTNWQNSQWLRHGAIRNLAESYSKLTKKLRILEQT